MIRVLVVEDSPVQRLFLSSLLEESGQFEVVGAAANGAEGALETERLRPDIVLMDCHMPVANGIEATKLIMQSCPTPIVIASASYVPDDVQTTFDAVRNGALAVVAKPTGFAAEGHEKLATELLRTLRLMAEVKVVRRWQQSLPAAAVPPQPAASSNPIEVVAIAGSTGAPGVLADILGPLVSDRTPPILIVQHLAEGFVEGFAQWLGTKTALSVHMAREGTVVRRGHVYVAPDGKQMGLSANGRVRLTDDPVEDGFRPSGSYLFRSVAKSYAARGLGIVLSGMGRDGAAGLAAMQAAGSHTAAQDKATSVVYGMASEAARLGAVKDLLPPTQLAKLILSTLSADDEECDGTRRKPHVA